MDLTPEVKLWQSLVYKIANDRMEIDRTNGFREQDVTSTYTPSYARSHRRAFS